MQVLFDVAPSDDECVPPGQTEHVLVPSVDEYVPAAHSSHTDIPVTPLNLPTAHLTQSLCSCAPILAECVPAGQLMQELTFDTLVDGWYVPDGHLTQVTLFCSYFPSGQSTQESLGGLVSNFLLRWPA